MSYKSGFLHSSHFGVFHSIMKQERGKWSATTLKNKGTLSYHKNPSKIYHRVIFFLPKCILVRLSGQSSSLIYSILNPIISNFYVSKIGQSVLGVLDVSLQKDLYLLE